MNQSIAAATQSSREREREAVLGVFAAVMRPLMHVAFQCGVSAREVSDVARRAFVQALEARLLAQNRPVSDARLALLAGLSRSEVVALREAVRSGAPHSGRASVSLDQITALLNVWHTHARFSGAYGLALDLDLYDSTDPSSRQFTELVEISCPGADPEAVLDELVAVGCAEIVNGTTLRCHSRAYVLRGTDVSITRIERAARFLETAAANFAHNLSLEDPPAYFERTLVSDYPLSDSVRDQFLKMVTEAGEEFVLELDTMLSKLVDQESATGGKRYGVGVYFFEEQSSGDRKWSGRSDASGNDRRRASVSEEIDVLAIQPRKK